MKPITLNILALVTLLIIFACYCDGYHVSADTSNLSSEEENLQRERRQVESFDDEYPTPAGQQEEPGFWDRIVKVALKLFSRFVEWLNS